MKAEMVEAVFAAARDAESAAEAVETVPDDGSRDEDREPQQTLFS